MHLRGLLVLSLGLGVVATSSLSHRFYHHLTLITLEYLLNSFFLTNPHESLCTVGFAKDQQIMNRNKYLVSNQSADCWPE
jgi:hypothetical protein